MLDCLVGNKVTSSSSSLQYQEVLKAVSVTPQGGQLGNEERKACFRMSFPQTVVKGCMPTAKRCVSRNPRTGTEFGVSLEHIFVEPIK